MAALLKVHLQYLIFLFLPTVLCYIKWKGPGQLTMDLMHLTEYFIKLEMSHYKKEMFPIKIIIKSTKLSNVKF